MPNINKPFYALAYSAFGVTLPPLVAKFVELVSGYEHSPTTWKVVWFISIVSLFVMAMSFLYLIIYVVPIEKLIFKAVHPVVGLFSNKQTEAESSVIGSTEPAASVSVERQETESTSDTQTETTASAEEEKAIEGKANESLPLDDRHRMFIPYVNTDENDNPVAPVLDILDKVFQNINQKKDVGMALYCAKSLKWITAFPPYKQMAAIFGEEIVGSSSNYATYMPPIREIDKDYGKADDEFLVEVRDMKSRLRKAAGIK